MDALLTAIKHYLKESLGLQLEPNPWKGKKDLPFYLQDLFVFYDCSLLGKPCILALERNSDSMTPALVRKYVEQIQEKTGKPCVYITASSSSYNRKRLVAHRVQFVIPGRQIYLPALGIDWLENCKIFQEHRNAEKTITPSTQVVVIYALLHRNEEQCLPFELAKRLDYTPMTMTRVFNELESLDIGKTNRKGKERRFSFIEDRSLLWQRAEPFMQNPVKRRTWIRLKKNSIEEIKHLGALAGLSALAELSMLSLPSHPTYAVSMQTWKAMQQSSSIQELPSEEEADIELEVWSYDPRLFANNGIIDSFSLYLSLKENEDERIEAALKELIKEIKW